MAYYSLNVIYGKENLLCIVGYDWTKLHQLLLSIHAPSYFGDYMCWAKNKDFKPLFYFYPNDIARCVKGTRRKWNKYCLDVPNVGPIPRGTNLIAHEIRTLEEIGFQLQQRQHMAHKQLFGNNEVVVAQIQNIFNQLILIITSYTRMAEPLVTT